MTPLAPKPLVSVLTKPDEGFAFNPLERQLCAFCLEALSKYTILLHSNGKERHIVHISCLSQWAEEAIAAQSERPSAFTCKECEVAIPFAEFLKHVSNVRHSDSLTISKPKTSRASDGSKCIIV